MPVSKEDQGRLTRPWKCTSPERMVEHKSEEAQMSGVFDIFKKLPDGKPLWITAVKGFEEARQHLHNLAAKTPGEYFIYSEMSGDVIARIRTSSQDRSAA